MKTPGAGPGLAGAVLFLCLCLGLKAEVCPTDKTDTTKPKSPKEVMNQLLLKPKSCPDFKDSAEQKHCCPSRITYGTYYCCTSEQLQEIEAEISAEKRREFLKRNLAIIIVFTIAIAIFCLVVLSMICRKYHWCPLNDQKDVYSQSGSFPASGSHSALGSRYYRPVEQAPPISHRNSQAFAQSLSMTLNQNKPHQTPWVDAPPPYDSIRHQAPNGPTPAQRQHDFNCIMENQLNQMRDSNPHLDS
ncbi:unnamed protein product [Bursaphelenchus okinawaensis]|uniref:CX domain-containing protein n=1 Tax=Bursaphelenchus okinawaensis TaxID=465554 RepID=A0A811KZJ6_9BILA|nr:unnamed protein product [Bursaphelenchus okinawaensis]CAG9114234.1 unnamed protein product [Bursaphelenchus okinawaensis]